MIDKLTDVSQEEAKQFEKDFGGYNDAPPGLKEITAEEFAQSGFFTWCIEKVEFRQVLSDRLPWTGEKYMLTLRMFYMNSPHEDGFAMSHDYWAQKVRYFRFTRCDHSYRELSVLEAQAKGRKHFGNCYHVHQCTKCGVFYEVDSSD